MEFEEKTPDLLALLIAYVRGISLAIPVVPRPPTPTSVRASSSDAAEKKRKRGQGGKGPEGVKEGKITHFSQQPPSKRPEQPGPNRRKVLLLELQKSLKVCNPQSLLCGDPSLR